MDYPDYLGYNGSNPNFLTDGIGLDQFLMGLLQTEGLAPISMDLETFLNDLFTLLSDPEHASFDLYTTVRNEADYFFYQLNGPLDESHPIQ